MPRSWGGLESEDVLTISPIRLFQMQEKLVALFAVQLQVCNFWECRGVVLVSL